MSSGLDLGLQFYDVLPTGPKEGFVEWLEGAVPLAMVISKYEAPEELARRQSATAQTAEAEKGDNRDMEGDDVANTATVTEAGTPPVLPCQQEIEDVGDNTRPSAQGGTVEEVCAMRTMLTVCEAPATTAAAAVAATAAGRDTGSSGKISTEGHLPAARPDSMPPRPRHSSVKTYFQRHSKNVEAAMNSFVKSCAGNSALTYLLGVGDRHLENILLQPSGTIVHCDFGFCFGRDPGHVLYRYIVSGLLHVECYRLIDFAYVRSNFAVRIIIHCALNIL